MQDTGHWVNIVTFDLVQKSLAGSYLQANKSQLEQVKKGDRVVFYSPRTRFRDGKPLQEFTALGLVADEEPYPSDRAEAWLRKMDFKSVRQAPIAPLVDGLSFILDKERWGLPFSKGLFEIKETDFQMIAESMGFRKS